MSSTQTALIIGASRGIGLGLVKQLQAAGWQVTATVRNPQGAGDLAELEGVEVKTLDLDSVAGLETLAGELDGSAFDLILVNAGVYGPAHQSAVQATEAEIAQLFLTNAVAPIRLAQRLRDKLLPGGTLAFMSSILGSVAGNDAGGLALYRASKAALNTLTRSLVAEWGDASPTVLSLHPGWVKTDMGGESAEIDVATSVQGLVQQIEAFAGRGGHHYIDYQGQTIPW
ncbi:SDR family oxidoreductase [Pseudomonas solani]|uniref:SDR family oxidoreductase n=1 Tax=Pseudomonas solani TaxID=2731552 RepID=A0AAU7Y3V0_9PSED